MSNTDTSSGPHPIRFEVRAGMRRISCDVSDEALEAAAGLTGPTTTMVRRKSFDRFRTLIDAAARLKLDGLPPEFAGPLILSAGDLRRVPPAAGMPAFGSVPRGS